MISEKIKLNFNVAGKLVLKSTEQHPTRSNWGGCWHGKPMGMSGKELLYQIQVAANMRDTLIQAVIEMEKLWADGADPNVDYDSDGPFYSVNEPE